MIDLVLHNTTRTRTYGEAFFRRVAQAAAPHLKIPRGHMAQVGVVLIGPARMRAMNKKHRGYDTSTDVLSFPLSTAPIAGYTAVSLGDLFICPADVSRKATETGQTVREQMAWTVVHGLLHLAGYDHEKSAAAARKMFTLEQKILKTL